MNRLKWILLLGCIHLNCFAWNSHGHQLVAQIAYDYLTPQAKSFLAYYFNTDEENLPEKLSKESVWLDVIRYRNNVHDFDHYHYIDIPFAIDGTKLPSIPAVNASWALLKAINALNDPHASSKDRRFYLRVLIHVMGDVHQPLHTVTRVDKNFPDGDLGGNLFTLKRNKIGKNLHQFWDNGGGFVLGRNFKLRKKADMLENQWPCHADEVKLDVLRWIDDSHQLSLNRVYTLEPNTKPTYDYKTIAQKTTKHQIALAGCRLAAVLNSVASH